MEATIATERSGPQEKDTPTNPLQAFLHGFINLKTMPLPLRIVTLAGFGLLGCVAAALALYDLPQLRVGIDYQFNGQTTESTLLALIVVVVVGGIALAYALAGAMSLRWLPRLVIVALVTGVLFEVPALDLQPGSSMNDSQFVVLQSIVVPSAQFALLGALWCWALGVSLARWRRARLRDGAEVDHASRGIGSLVVALAFIVVFFGLDLIPWAIAHGASGALGRAADALLVGDLVAPVYIFALTAPLFVYWFSTDSTEWSTSLAAGTARLTGRVPWLMPVLTAIVALAIGADDVRLAGSQLVLPVLAAAIVAALATLLVTLAPAPTRWPAQVPLFALVAGVLTLFAVIDLPIIVIGTIGASGVFSAQLIAPLTGGMTALDALAAIVLGLALAAWGRLRGRGNYASAGLLMALVAALVFIAGIGQIQSDLGVTLLPQPKHIQAGIECVLVLATLGLLLSLALHRRPLATWTGALTGPFVALIGLQVVDWYTTFALDRSNASPSSVTVIALFFLASQVWDVLRSGEPITNGDSPRAPRASRVLIYFGYILLSAALFLYASSLRVAATGAAVPQYLFGNDNSTFILALVALCPPLALVTGFTRFQQWRATTMIEAEAAAPRRVGRARLLFGGVVSSGVVLTAIASVIILASVARAPYRAPTTYFTHTPGPNCDTHGASWTALPGVATQCQANGLRLTASEGAVTQVGFLPPGGLKGNDFHVSVRLTFDQTGCAGLTTRGSERGFYQHQICADGSWSMLAFDLNTGQPHYLAIGNVAPSGTYTLGITDRGSQLTMTIDSATVGSAVNTQFPNGFIDLAIFNLSGSGPATIIFSDFGYAPLAS